MMFLQYYFVISILSADFYPTQAKRPSFEFLDVYANISLGGFVNKTAHSIWENNKLNCAFILNKNASDWTAQISFHMLTENNRRIQLFKTDVDFCQYKLLSKRNKFFAIMLKELIRTSNFPKRCFLEANKEYGFRNYTLRSSDYPESAPELNWVLVMDVYFNRTPGLQLTIIGRVKRY